MKLQTGKLPLTTAVLVAILSLSLVVNLPGLAISPMLGTLSDIFPKTTQLEKQLLTLLPNLLIIPFVLLSGKLSLSKHKIAIVVTALLIFGCSTVGYMFSRSMLALIIFSCTLGIGAGMLIPFSTGLLADTFAGKYRMKMMGWQSGISNITLVCATFAVGWLSHGNWHLPFIVYFVFIIPLVCSFWLKKIPAEDLDNDSLKNFKVQFDPRDKFNNNIHSTKGGFIVSRIVATFLVYFFITYLTIIISYYTPFVAEKRAWNADITGTVTSLFFLFIFIPGFLLPKFVRICKQSTLVICSILIAGGLACMAFIPTKWAMCVGSSLCGLGYGTFQPLLYDKATHVITNQAKATLALAIILSANYISIVLTPFIVDGLRDLFHAQHVAAFSFILNFILGCAFLVLVILARKCFVFGIPHSYFDPDKPDTATPATTTATTAPAAAPAAAPAQPATPDQKPS